MNKKKIFLVMFGLFLSGALILSLAIGKKNEKPYFSLSDLKPGTNVNYRITSNDQVLDQGNRVVGGENDITVFLNQEEIKSADDLQYSFSFEDEVTGAQTLDMLLDIKRSENKAKLKATGLPQFSDVSINKDSKTTSDWAGLLSAESDLQDMPMMQMAFQNSGVDADFNPFGDAKIEVFLGDSSADNINDVRARYTRALFDMVHELSIAMVVQTQAIGMFFDAENFLRTQRKHQELRARAHKDYHPSEQMCRVGTFVRSVAHSESAAELTKHALNRILMNQYLAVPNNSAEEGTGVYESTRLLTYKNEFCDPRDFGGVGHAICEANFGFMDVEDMNTDIEYARTLAGKLTLDVDFLDDPSNPLGPIVTLDEIAIIALSKNLYSRNVFVQPPEDSLITEEERHYNSRSYAAKMNVAHNSFINIVGMKSAAREGQPTSATLATPEPPFAGPIIPRTNPPTILAEDTGWAYMKAMMREFGITDENGDGSIEDEIDELLGERPSYYAQMEVLTKKIYQNPNFFTNLYDKPANVQRIGVSLDAIELMHQRDRFDSLLRREMLSALLVEQALIPHSVDTNANIQEEMIRVQYPD